MLTNKQLRMLELLDKKVDKCPLCSLKDNGTALPHWTEDSRYVIIGESPNMSDVRSKRPFMGAGGRVLREILSTVGLKSKDFLIINSVQCVPDYRGSNGKPDLGQLEYCKGYIRKYIKVINPEKILCLGNYAKYIFTHEVQGVLRQRGVFNEWDIGGGYIYPVMFTVNPNYCVYNPEEGKRFLREDIMKFKEAYFGERIDWLFKEDEFLI